MLDIGRRATPPRGRGKRTANVRNTPDRRSGGTCVGNGSPVGGTIMGSRPHRGPTRNGRGKDWVRPGKAWPPVKVLADTDRRYLSGRPRRRRSSVLPSSKGATAPPPRSAEIAFVKSTCY